MEGKFSDAAGRKRVIIIICLFAALALWTLVGEPGSFGGQWLGDAIRQLRAYEATLGWMSLPLFWLTGTLAIIVNIPTIVVIAIAAVIYGTAAAILIALACLLPASYCIYIIGHTVGRRFVSRLFARYLPRLEEHFARSALATVIYIRLIFFALPPVNWALAVMNLRPGEYVLGTFIGALPHILAWAWATGAAAELLARGQAIESSTSVMVPLVLGLALMGVLEVSRGFMERRSTRSARH